MWMVFVWLSALFLSWTLMATVAWGVFQAWRWLSG